MFNGELYGVSNVFKAFGQALFYSAASGNTYMSSLRRVPTWAELYKILSWQSYTRAIGAYGKTMANDNAALLRAVEESLTSPSKLATFFVGHDGNVDGLLKLLNISEYQIPPFYGGKIVATPPGCAMHFKQDGDTITIDFLYFVPSTGRVLANTRSSTGVLSSTRLLTLTTAQWQARIASGLAANGAQACYDAGTVHLANQRAAAGTTGSSSGTGDDCSAWGSYAPCMGAREIVAWVGFAVFGLLMIVFLGLAVMYYMQATAPAPVVDETPEVEEAPPFVPPLEIERSCC